MQVHDISAPRGARKRRKIVGRGRGSGWGKTSGRGENGQRAREGRNVNRASEGGQQRLIRRLPKVGFNSHRPKLFQVVNVETLNRLTKDTIVTVELLKEKQMISSVNKLVKILGKGELKKALIVQIDNVSKTAQEKIQGAGGKVEEAPKTVENKKEANKES